MPRLFVGIEVGDEIAATLSGLRGGIHGARWIEPADYHLTLRFVGDVGGDVAEDLIAGLAGIAPRGEVPVAIERLDVFGGERPHAVIAAATPSPALVELQAEVERIARAAGLEPERRKFSPHVTLARCRGASPIEVARWISARAPLPPLAFTARRLCVYSARAKTGGGPYVVEAAVPLVDGPITRE